MSGIPKVKGLVAPAAAKLGRYVRLTFPSSHANPRLPILSTWVRIETCFPILI